MSSSYAYCNNQYPHRACPSLAPLLSTTPKPHLPYPSHPSRLPFPEPQKQLSRTGGELRPRVLLERRAVLARRKAHVEAEEQFREGGAHV